ncbi:MAG: hypothetical protein H0U70_06220 [Tatlockia sp.]|nr:hypothetical protein [Tatlockia sp.]
MSFFNPFNGLIETKEFPNARMHRTTFWEKIWDTFKVFSGTIAPDFTNENPSPYKKMHFGIFDYLTLGIHYLITQLLLFMVRKAAKESIYLAAPMMALAFIFSLPRLIFANALTFICSPFVLVAHAFVNDKAKNSILSYEVRSNEYPLHFAPSFLPSELERYKESFIFIADKNVLYYIDIIGNSRQMALKNIESFRKEYKVNGNHAISFGQAPFYLLTRAELGKYLGETIYPLNTYNSLGKILKAKNIDLEDVGYSELEIDKQDKNLIRLSLKDRVNGKLLSKFSLCLTGQNDLTLFKNLKELNIAGVQAHIEEDEELSHAFI